LQNFKQADFVVEAVSEDEQLKRGIFQQLDKVRCGAGPLHVAPCSGPALVENSSAGTIRISLAAY
jgi:hypothetical protein